MSQDFDIWGWTPEGDTRTNAELRAAWEELGRSDPQTEEEWSKVIYQQDLIHFELTMRKWHRIGDDWVHPCRDDPRWKLYHGSPC